MEDRRGKVFFYLIVIGAVVVCILTMAFNESVKELAESMGLFG